MADQNTLDLKDNAQQPDVIKKGRYNDEVKDKKKHNVGKDIKDLNSVKEPVMTDQHTARGGLQDSKPDKEVVPTDQHTASGGLPDSKPDKEVVTTDQHMVKRDRDALKECLHSVMVSKRDAANLERTLEGEIFDKWHESCEVMKTTKIPIIKIDGFLDHLKDAYEGIDDKIREKMNTIKTENQDIVEWNFNTDNESGVRYGMVAFGRSADQKYVDCMYALYKIDFTIAPKEKDSVNKHSSSKALLSYTKTTVKKKNHTNFFRLKALEGFFREGLIEEINYVGSLDDIPDLFER